MSYIGKYAEFRIDRFTSVGAYLSDDKDFEVLLPNKYLNDNMELDQNVRVFVYNDSEDRPVATTEIPYITLNGFAYLKVKSVNNFGAFLDWGLEKDLMVPFKQQNEKMEEGKSYLIHLYLDEQTDRLVGTAKVNNYLSTQIEGLEIGNEVDLLVGGLSQLGRKVVINNTYQGLIFRDRIVKPIDGGDKLKGYIEFIRQDGKIDVSLVPVGVEKFDEFSAKVLEYITNHDGKIFLTDSSDPELIRDELGMSKKSYKKALGSLYKQKKIQIFDDYILINKKS